MTRKQNQKKPEPYGHHKIWAHPNGQWCKKRGGKVYYLGPWSDPKAAELAWKRVLLELENQESVSRDTLLTVQDLCERYYAHKQEQCRRGDINGKTLRQAEVCCRLTWESMGDTLLDEVTSEDFRRLRATKIDESLAPTTVNRHIAGLRAIWNFGSRNGLLQRNAPWGDHLNILPARVVRVFNEQKRSTYGAKFFEAHEVRSLIEFADDQMRAAVLVCLNCGYGPSDLGHLGRRNVQGRWARLHRNKTGIPRNAYLWPETLEALEKIWTEDQIFSFNADREGHVDLTKRFRDLCLTARCLQKHRGVYALRSTFRTVADATGDLVVINDVMGHADGSMGSVYRQHIAPERHIRVSDHVRSWFLGEVPATH